MSGKRTKTRGPADEDPQLLSAIHAAMSRAGWQPPIEEADVRQAERELSAAGPMPASLNDLDAVFTRGGGDSAKPRPLVLLATDPVGSELARAARQGGSISPEVLERMKADRKAAEQGGKGSKK
jgi:hypothetical protein